MGAASFDLFQSLRPSKLPEFSSFSTARNLPSTDQFLGQVQRNLQLTLELSHNSQKHAQNFPKPTPQLSKYLKPNLRNCGDSEGSEPSNLQPETKPLEFRIPHHSQAERPGLAGGNRISVRTSRGWNPPEPILSHGKAA